jgi:GT2 family glycosyltransferase
MEIQVIVPWGADGNLGKAYNRSMKDVTDWVCFLDHDILHVNPQWYHICLAVAEQLGHQAGWITGVTNRIACPYQICADSPKTDDVMAHMRYAKKRYNKYSANAHMLDPKNIQLEFSGFMILTHKKAWEDAGGFCDGFLGVDNDYHRRIIRAGYKTYVLPGLYMYHIYGAKRQWETF